MDNRVDSVLSIRYPGHTRLWTGGGASAGSEIGWLTSGWTPPTRFLPIRIEDPLAMPIDRGAASASGLIIPANQDIATPPCEPPFAGVRCLPVESSFGHAFDETALLEFNVPVDIAF